MQLGLRQTRVWETLPNRKYTDYLCVPKRRLCCGLHNSEEKFVNRKRSALSLGSLQILMFLMVIFVPSCNNRLTTLKKMRNSERNSAMFLRTNYAIYISVEVNWGLGRNSMFRNLLIRYWHSKNKLIENWKQLPNSQWNYNIWWAKNSRWFFFHCLYNFTSLAF